MPLLLPQPFPPMNTGPPYGLIDVLPHSSTFQPSIDLTITYSPSTSGSETISLGTSAGAKLTWQQTESRPSISFPAQPAHGDSTYTLMMTDPDAPTPYDTKYAYWRHWIQPGLHPSSVPGVEAKSDKVPLTEYLAPGKKEPSADPHRYLVLLFREPAAGHPYHSLTPGDVGAESFEARRAFDAKGWIKRYELEPAAVLWFWGSG